MGIPGDLETRGLNCDGNGPFVGTGWPEVQSLSNLSHDQVCSNPNLESCVAMTLGPRAVERWPYEATSVVTRFSMESLAVRFVILVALCYGLAACSLRASPTPTASAAPPAATPTTALVPTAPVLLTNTVGPTPFPATATPTDGLHDLTGHASGSVSAGAASAALALDGNANSLWSAGGPPPQTYQLVFDNYYLVSRIELLVAQTPDGQTSHEIWVGDSIGKLKLYKSLVNIFTTDGQITAVDTNSPIQTDRVMIRTTGGPSFVAWRDIRVLGREFGANGSTTAGAVGETGPVVDWPKIKLAGAIPMPVQITSAGDGSDRIFVSAQTGQVRVPKAGILLPTPPLDLSDRGKCCGGEQVCLESPSHPDLPRSAIFMPATLAKTVAPSATS